MPYQVNEDGKLQAEIFKVFPTYHELSDEQKVEILELIIAWAKHEIDKQTSS